MSVAGIPPKTRFAMKKTLIFLAIGMGLCAFSPFWGFYAHRKINRLAVFTLPPAMITFYKVHVNYLTETAVNPDRRRYVVEKEAPRHYLDLDHYPDSVELPRGWLDAVERFGEDSLREHGILPWYIFAMYLRLRDAFMVGDSDLILRTSSDLGHYIADAHVPLHTTRNYNGQLTGQEGIHGLWESRLPELFSEEYDFFVGPARYLHDPQEAAWQIVRESHSYVEDVLGFEAELSQSFGEKRFGFETRGRRTVNVYTEDYCRAYHQRLGNTVESRMRQSILLTGSFWYTAWVDAGQPDLKSLLNHIPEKEELEERRAAVKRLRGHID